VSSAICVLQCHNLNNIFKKPKSQFQKVKHLIVPVGKVPDSGEESYFVAELSDTRPSQLNYHWKSAEGYFTVEKIVTGESISCE
jgi:hypothetical protein